MAPTAKANYKSYDAQARLIRAIVAAHPDVKWNYKEIVACFGSDMTLDALNHRFRRFKAEAAVIATGRKQGFDMKDLGVGDDLPKAQKDIDTKNIAKYFGQSTGDGMQFQFRAIKKDAKTLIDAHKRGAKSVSNDQLSGMNGGGGGGGGSSAYSTPTTQRIKSTPHTGSTKRKGSFIKRETVIDDEDDDPLGGSDEDADESGSQDWSEKDLLNETPSKKQRTTASANRTPGQKNGAPARRAAAKRADATIADATANMSESMSERETDLAPTMPPMPSMSSLQFGSSNGTGNGNGYGIGTSNGGGMANASVNPQSIFGNPSPSPAPGARGMTPLAFNHRGFDSLIGGAEFEDELNTYYGGDYGGDEEI